MARCLISAEVQGPMPGRDRRRRSASAGSVSSASSSRAATAAAVMIVWARTPSTPARCQSQEGMRAQARGGGNTRMPPGAGPGAGDPWARSRNRQARWASRPTTFCSSTAGTSASKTRPVRPTRRPAYRSASAPITAWRAAKPARSSWKPSWAGTRSSSQLAPGPQAWAVTVAPRDPTRSVAGPSGVSDVRQTAPAASVP